MFEEVPRTRRGLSSYLGLPHVAGLGSPRSGLNRLTARRIVLGPFVIGGGVVLTAVGGSVAVAATVFTASTIRASDVPPHQHAAPVVAVTSSSASKVNHAAAPHAASPSITSSASAATSLPGGARPAVTAAPSHTPVTGSIHPASSTPSASASAPVTSPATGTPTPSGSPSSTPDPQGNAIVYVSAWDHTTRQLTYQFASVSPGTGPDHSDVYAVTSARTYHAGLAADLKITSGGQLCPPAGSSCTTEQLIAAAGRGFYAVVAIDPAGSLHSVIEKDNVTSTQSPTGSPTAFAPGPTPTPTPTPTG